MRHSQNKVVFLWLVYSAIIFVSTAKIWIRYPLYKDQYVWLFLWSVVFSFMLMMPKYPVTALVVFVLISYGTPRYGVENRVLYDLNLINQVTVLSVLGFIVWWQKHRTKIKSNALSLMVLLFLTWVGISYIANFSTYSPRDYVEVNHSPVQYLHALVFCFIASQVLVDNLSIVLFTFSLYIAALGRAAYLFIHDQIYLASDIGILTALSFPLCIGMVMTMKKTISKVVLGAGLCFFPLIVLLTQNRTAGIAFGLVLLLLMSIGSNKIKLAGVAALAGGVALAYDTLITYWNRFSVIWDRSAGHATSSLDVGTMLERLNLWKIGWQMLKENMVFGVGPGNYSYFVHDMANRELSRTHIVAHNSIVNVASETGVIGLILYMGLLLLPFYYCLKINRRHQGTTGFSIWAKLLMISFLAFISAGFFSSRQDYVLFYVLVGWTIGLASSMPAKGDSAKTPFIFSIH